MKIDMASWLSDLSGFTSAVILLLAVCHIGLFVGLWVWYRRDGRRLAGCLDEFTGNLKHRSVLNPTDNVSDQIDAFIHDIQNLLQDRSRHQERQVSRERIHVLDERRSYLNSLSFETTCNVARTMIEAYPLAGVLGTVLAIGAALQSPDTQEATVALTNVVARFGDAIWSTFFGLSAAIVLMLINSILEPRFLRLSQRQQQVADLVALAKRELGIFAKDTPS